MEAYYDIVKSNPLFHHFTAQEFSSILSCLGAYTGQYEKKEVIYLAGEEVSHIGVVLSGSVKIIQEDIHANESILTEVGVGGTFAEVFPCADLMESPVTVMAREKTQVLFLNFKKVMETCGNSCAHHRHIIANLLRMISQKCLFLNQKVEILSKRSTREKILAFLLHEGKGGTIIKTDLNREEMANFLCVDRSALSGELSKMQKEGIISYHKNKFQIL